MTILPSNHSTQTTLHLSLTAIRPVGWGRNQNQNNMNQFGNMQGYGQASPPSFKENLVYLIHSVRTVMRREYLLEFQSV